MRGLKIKIMILVIVMFYGCAPHYYLFEKINTKNQISDNENVFLGNETFVNMHLMNNQVLINAQYEIVNNSGKEVLINSQSFVIQSQIYNYKMLSFHSNNQRKIKKSNKIKDNSPIHLLPYDSVSIAVYYSLDKKIKEKHFTKERLQDTVVNSINLNGINYIYMFKPIERK